MPLLPITGLLGKSISGAAAGALLQALLGWEADLVKSLVADVVNATTAVTPAQGNGWFATVAQQMAYIEPFAMAPLLFVATISAVAHQDLRRLVRAWGAGLPLALLGGFAVANLAFLGINVTDGLSSFVQARIAPDLGTDFADAVALNGAAGPVGALFGVVVLVGGVAIWLELVLRSAAIELAVFFMPLAFAGLVWPSTAHMAKRLLHVLVALLVAKPVIVAALCLGDNALLNVRGSPSAVVTGAAILLMAGFAPMVLLKLVPMVEISAIAHLQGVVRQPIQTAERAVQHALSLAGSVIGSSSLGEPPASAAHLLGQLEGTGAGTSTGASGHGYDGAHGYDGLEGDLGPASYPRAQREGEQGYARR